MHVSGDQRTLASFASLPLVSGADNSKGDWVYLIKLHLQDATGEVDAALFDRDADEFFQVRCRIVLHTEYRLATMISSLTAAASGGPSQSQPHQLKICKHLSSPLHCTQLALPGTTSIGLS